MTECTDAELASHWCLATPGIWKSPCCQLTVVGNMRLLGLAGAQAPDAPDACPEFLLAAQGHLIIKPPKDMAQPPPPLTPDEEAAIAAVRKVVDAICDVTQPCPAGYEQERQQWVELKAGNCTACEEASVRRKITKKVKGDLTK